MQDIIRVKLLRDVFPLKENIEIMGFVRFKSSYVQNVYEDIKRERQYDDSLIPHIIFLIDISYSMDEDSKIETLKNSLLKFIDYGYLDNTYLSIVTFGKKSEIILDYSKVSENKEDILNKIRNIKANEPQTYVYTGFQKIYNEISLYERNGVNKIIYFTDGEDFDTDMAIKEAKKLVKEKKYTITSVGTGIEYNESFLEDIADIGKGGFYHLNSVENFFNDIKFELQQTNNEIMTKSEIVSLFYPSKVEPVDIYKVGKGVTKLDIEKGEIICGNISPDDRIFFKFKLRDINKAGKYNILNATIKYYVGKREERKEFSFKVTLSNDPELLQNASIDTEVMEINKQVMAYKKVKQAQKLFNEGKEREARTVINEISPIIKSLTSDEEIENILDDIKNGRSITAEITRTLLSHTRTKTMTKTDTA